MPSTNCWMAKIKGIIASGKSFLCTTLRIVAVPIAKRVPPTIKLISAEKHIRFLCVEQYGFSYTVTASIRKGPAVKSSCECCCWGVSFCYFDDGVILGNSVKIKNYLKVSSKEMLSWLM